MSTTHRPLLPSRLTALALLAPTALADVDTAASSAHLSANEAVIGGTVELTLRSPLVGSPALFAFGTSPTPIPAGPAFPVILVGPSFATVGGFIGTDGRLVGSLPISPAYPAGLEFFVQGAVVSVAPFKVHGSQALRLAPGGTGGTYSPTPLPAVTALYASSDVDWVDVNKDGFQDILLANDGSGSVPALLINQGGTGFLDDAGARIPPPAQIPLALTEASDVDLDGDLDLFLGAGQDLLAPAANLLLLNDGTGVYSIDPAFPGGAGIPLDAEFGDIDGDGDQDLLIANYQDPDHPGETPDGIELYLNTGAVFTPKVSFATLPATDPHTAGGSISLGDVDNDGDLDVFVARADTGAGGLQNQLLLNDGSGIYTDVTASSLPVITDNSFEAEFVDVDGDGLLDVFVANSISSVPGAHVLFNLGDAGGVPSFADFSVAIPSNLGPATNIRQGVDVADVDGDGDQDILVAIHQLFDTFGQLDGDAVLLINDGGHQGGIEGTFALDPTFDVGGAGFICSDVAFGDADADGDPDLFLASLGDLFGVQLPQDVLLLNSL